MLHFTCDEYGPPPAGSICILEVSHTTSEVVCEAEFYRLCHWEILGVDWLGGPSLGSGPWTGAQLDPSLIPPCEKAWYNEGANTRQRQCGQLSMHGYVSMSFITQTQEYYIEESGLDV